MFDFQEQNPQPVQDENIGESYCEESDLSSYNSPSQQSPQLQKYSQQSQHRSQNQDDEDQGLASQKEQQAPSQQQQVGEYGEEILEVDVEPNHNQIVSEVIDEDFESVAKYKQINTIKFDLELKDFEKQEIHQDKNSPMESKDVPNTDQAVEDNTKIKLDFGISFDFNYTQEQMCSKSQEMKEESDENEGQEDECLSNQFDQNQDCSIQKQNIRGYNEIELFDTEINKSKNTFQDCICSRIKMAENNIQNESRNYLYFNQKNDQEQFQQQQQVTDCFQCGLKNQKYEIQLENNHCQSFNIDSKIKANPSQEEGNQMNNNTNSNLIDFGALNLGQQKLDDQRDVNFSDPGYGQCDVNGQNQHDGSPQNHVESPHILPDIQDKQFQCQIQPNFDEKHGSIEKKQSETDNQGTQLEQLNALVSRKNTGPAEDTDYLMAQNANDFNKQNNTNIDFDVLLQNTQNNPPDPIVPLFGPSIEQKIGQEYNTIPDPNLDNMEYNVAKQNKLPKIHKNKAHFNLIDFYDIRKIKYTLDFQNLKKLEKCQFIYTLDLKNNQQLTKIINDCKEAGHKRIYIDLGFHIKQFQVQEIWILERNQKLQQVSKKKEIPIPNESETFGLMQSLGQIRRSSLQTDHLDQTLLQHSKAKSWYLTPKMQATFYSKCFNYQKQDQYGNIIEEYQASKDLNSLDYLQKDSCYYKESEQTQKDRDEADYSYTEILGKKPELQISKLFTLKLKGGDTQIIIDTQLQKELKILVSIGRVQKNELETIGQCETITDFGIRTIDYKIKNSQEKINYQQSTMNQELRSYTLTSDTFEASQSWLPQIFGTSRVPVYWSMSYLVPTGIQVISSGEFMHKKEFSSKQKDLHVFKIKERNSINGTKGKVIPDKIGFVLGEFPYISIIDEKNNENDQQNPKQIGAALFTSNSVCDLFESNHFYQTQIQQIIENLEKMLKIDHPYKDTSRQNQNLIKMVFLPNLFTSKQIKQQINFSNCIHIFDEEILLPRNVIEKRHKIYKILATSLAYDYFGNMVWEESEEDAWLITGLRERIGDRNKRLKCGQSLYRYNIMKTMNKFIKSVQLNAERFSLSSKYVPHFSELEYGEDLYLQKCQLIMHILEQILGETHFFNVTRDLLNKSNPTLSVQLFKKVLRDIGIKFQDIQKNWIDSTSCPRIECSYKYNRKNNSVNINLEQHSVVKSQLLFQKYLQQNKNEMFEMCLNGQLLLSNLEEAFRDEKIEQIQQFEVELQRDCRRWFQGDIKVVIYQTDGAEIQVQTQKIKLKCPQTKVTCNIPLQCKVRKAIHNKKRDENMLMDDYENNDQRDDQNQMDSNPSKVDFNRKTDHLQLQISKISAQGANAKSTTAIAEQLLQQQNDNNQWRFGMMDYEFEEFPERGTRSLFEVKNIEQPILWIRVDPDFEYIRRVKIHQTKENWLFQLLQERDHIGQIEACIELKKYNDEFVYEILKSVSKNEKFFIKVRKQALRSLEFIQVSAFSQYLSHEKSFLINYYNSRNFNDKIGYYKSNDFKNILEYYLNTYLLRSLANSKERKLAVLEKKYDQMQEQNQQLAQNRRSYQQQPLEMLNQQLEIGAGRFSLKISNSIKDDFQPNQQRGDADIDMDSDNQKGQKNQSCLDIRDFSITSDLISNIMIRLLRENDNSDNAFDDSFFIGKILSNLGKLDNFVSMPEIAKEIQRLFNLDHISKFSVQFAVSKGAIKGYYNMRKQIYRYKQFKLPHLDASRCQLEIDQFQKCIDAAEVILDQMQGSFDMIINDDTWPLELRTFIFEKNIKSQFQYTENVHPSSNIPSKFLNRLYLILKQIQNASLKNHKFTFASHQLEILAKFMEKYYLHKLNFYECLAQNDQKCKVVANILWYMMAEQPITFIDKKISHWTKRIYNQLFFGSNVPLSLEFEHIQKNIAKAYKVEIDQVWHDSEAQQQEQSDQQDVLKQQNIMLGGPNIGQTDIKLINQNVIQNQQDFNSLGIQGMENQVINPNQFMNFSNQVPNILSNGIQLDAALAAVQFPMQNDQLNAANILLPSTSGALFGGPTGMGELTQSLAQTDPFNPALFQSMNINYQNQIIQNKFNEVNNANFISLNFLSQNQPVNDMPVNNNFFDFSKNVEFDQKNIPILQDNIPVQSNFIDLQFDENEYNNIFQQKQADPIQKKKKKKSKKAKKENQNYGDENMEQAQQSQQNYNAADNAGGFPRGKDQYKQDADTLEYKPITYDAWPEQNVIDQLSNEEDVIIQEEVDDFPDYKFDDVWLQKCWDILYLMYYDVESSIFVMEISEAAMGADFYYEYINTIATPINFLMIKQKMQMKMYRQPVHFIEDMLLVFDNCMQFNKRGSNIYKSAQKMKKKFKELVKQRKVYSHQIEIDQASGIYNTKYQ